MESEYSGDLPAAAGELMVRAITVEIAKLSLSPGDVLVAALKHEATTRQVEDIKAFIAKALPYGVEVLVHGPGAKLSVVTQAQVAE